MNKKRLLLIGWDAADWSVINPLVKAGLMPGFSQLIDKGTCGKLRSMDPQLSPMLWSSIATGHTPIVHGVPGFIMPTENGDDTRSLLSSDLKKSTLWDILSHEGKKCHIVNWFATHGSNPKGGCVVSDRFAALPKDQWRITPEERQPSPANSVWPEHLAPILNPARLSPTEMDGNEVIRYLVPEAHTIDQTKDPLLARLADSLSRSYTTHNAITGLMELEPDWDFCAVYYSALDEISHYFMPYRPPKLRTTPEDYYELYQYVVDRAYLIFDQMLQRLIQLAGEDTTIVLVSDHGFKTGDLRPSQSVSGSIGMTSWHHSQGIVAIKGEHVAKNRQTHGARILDIAPTILQLLDLPISAEMEGRILHEVFNKTIQPKIIDTWDHALPEKTLNNSEQDSAFLIEHFSRLGYIDNSSKQPSVLAQEIQCENSWNMGLSELYQGRYKSALPFFEECVFHHPERTEYLELLARCQINLGLYEEAEGIVKVLFSQLGNNLSSLMVQASLSFEKKDYKATLRQLRALRSNYPNNLGILQLTAQAQIQLRLWDDAEATTQTILEIEPQDAGAYMRLSRISLHRGDFQKAIDFSLQSTALNFGLPDTHLLLGIAFANVGETDKAIESLSTHLKLSPHSAIGWRIMGSIKRQLGEPTWHEFIANSIKVRTEKKKNIEKNISEIRSESKERSTQRIETRKKRRSSGDRGSLTPKEIIVVTGLPRSGTSLVMQMLDAAGCPILQDQEREADLHNPQGYLEWSKTKVLMNHPDIIRKAHQMAVKVVSPLLPSLEVSHHYKIIHVSRSVDEVLASQQAMLDDSSHTTELLKSMQQLHSNTKLTIKQLVHAEVLDLNYSEILENPQKAIDQISQLLGNEYISTPELALSVPAPKLHRQRIAIA